MVRLVRFRSHDGTFWGEFEPDGIVPLIGDPFGSHRRDSRIYQHRDVQLLAPVKPSKIVCVGLNYRAHADESHTQITDPSEPLLFFKPPSSLIGPGQVITLPAQSSQVEHEGELAVVIGRIASKVSADEASEFVFGVTCANDITARDLQRKDNQWTRAKGFDTFCPVGPWLCRGIDWSRLSIRVSVNGELRQRGSTDEMVFPIADIISYISHIMTLDPGDVILTGTPAGVGPLAPGDTVEVQISEIGSLVNTVRGA